MRAKMCLARLLTLSIFYFATFVSCAAAQEKILHSFGSLVNDGAQPGGLVFDSSGNLFGPTVKGGTNNLGTVFELTPAKGEGWFERDLFNFDDTRSGVWPLGNLILDSSGNLYGTTLTGGIHEGGTAFELKHWPTGGWSQKILHSFGAANDGITEYAGLIFDAAGNLYGTSNARGPGGSQDGEGGTVFQLSPVIGGPWTETMLYGFKGVPDGYGPHNGLIWDAAGNLYGATRNGGIDGASSRRGIVYELSPSVGGGWSETILHYFADGHDGFYPSGSLIFDAAGNLYGVTANDSSNQFSNGGTVYELLPTSGGGWTEKILHFFGAGSDGGAPTGPLVFDSAGNLYGVTQVGGIYNKGTVFKLSPNSDGSWTETILHNFGKGNDGAMPGAGLIFDGSGNLYGTTSAGGLFGNGTVFEITL